MIDSLQPLDGQTAIVTGGASGIGKATALRLAKAGVRVAVADINPDTIEATLAELRALGSDPGHIGIKTDVSSETDVEAMTANVFETFGRIDILVHSAGILRPAGYGPRILPQIDENECNKVIDINLKGTFLCDRAVIGYMMRQRGGQIINISSTSGLKGLAFDSVYCASKFGVIGLTESLAEEVRQFGIKVHLVLPNAVDTPLWDRNHVRAPEGSLSPDRVALSIELMLRLPDDMLLKNVIVMPHKTRKRKKKAAADTAEG
ncbi:MAG TPA: SDR family oxidoreductase [Kiritimatiellia bacterium]|nr:SDR family oxidoreductase [Kiritimatiellia bacterium]